MQTTARYLCLLGLTAGLLVSVTGCGKKAGTISSAEALKVFESAPAEIKQTWAVVIEAGKTNDFVGAETLLFGLMRQDLSPEQRQAASTKLGEIHQTMLDKVAKGDAAAQQALQELQQNPPNRPRRTQ